MFMICQENNACENGQVGFWPSGSFSPRPAPHPGLFLNDFNGWADQDKPRQAKSGIGC